MPLLATAVASSEDAPSRCWISAKRLSMLSGSARRASTSYAVVPEVRRQILLVWKAMLVLGRESGSVPALMLWI